MFLEVYQGNFPVVSKNVPLWESLRGTARFPAEEGEAAAANPATEYR